MGLRKVTIVDITSRIRFLHARRRPERSTQLLFKLIQGTLGGLQGSTQEKGGLLSLTQPSRSIFKNQVYIRSTDRKKRVTTNSWKTTDPQRDFRCTNQSLLQTSSSLPVPQSLRAFQGREACTPHQRQSLKCKYFKGKWTSSSLKVHTKQVLVRTEHKN